MDSRDITSAAFEAPECADSAIGDKKPLDLVHLSRQTMNDRDLEREILQMFVRNARPVANGMDIRDPSSTKRYAHTLKGTASAVGAMDLAAAAARLEAEPASAAALDAVLDQVTRVEDYIASIMR